MRIKQRQVTLKDIPLGNDLSKVRNQLNQLSKPTSNFKDPVTVIALQQGIGKTNLFIEYAKNHWKKKNEKIILASPRHNHLEEVYNKLGKKSARHWYGFSYKDKYNIYKGCNKLNKNIPLLNNIKQKDNESLLSPRFICSLLGCSKNKCRYYITRFNSDKIDLMPIEYLGTKEVLTQNPKILFIDESIDKIEEYTYDPTIISNCITIAQKNNYTQLVNNLNLLIPKPKIGSIQQTLIDIIKVDIDNLITKCIQNNNITDALLLNRIEKVLKYLELAPSYASDVYYRPKIYDAFDLAYKHEIRVVFLNASFNDDLFKYFLETYPIKIGNLNIPKYTSNIINKKSTLIRMYPKNKYWKNSFAKYNYKKTIIPIFQVLNIIEKYLPKERIGIITYLTSGDRNGNVKVEDIFIQKGYNTIHFWDEAGLNILENKYILVIIGTPFIPVEEIIDLWEYIHDEKTQLTEKNISFKDDNGFYVTDNLESLEYEDWEVAVYLWTMDTITNILKKWGYFKPHYLWWYPEIFMKFFNDEHTKKYDFSSVMRQYIDQMTDSIHRCRPLTHDRIIVVFGDVLARYQWDAWKTGKSRYETIDSINPLLGLKQIETDDISQLKKIIKDHNVNINNKIREILEFVIDNKDYNNDSSLAKSLNVWDKSNNPDVKFIKDIEKTIDDVKKKTT